MGANVIRSLVMLMASGSIIHKEIIPILIDFDECNGNKGQTLSLLSLYNHIQQEETEYNINNMRFFYSKLSDITNGWELNEFSSLFNSRDVIQILRPYELGLDKYKKLLDSVLR